MARRGNGDMGFEVTVDGGPAKKSISDIQQKLRDLAKTAEDSGGKIDGSVKTTAGEYKSLAEAIAGTVEAEEKLERAAQNTRNARNRADISETGKGTAVEKGQTQAAQTELVLQKAVTEEIRRGILLREQGNRDLIAKSNVSLIEDKREDLAEQRQARRQQKVEKAAADEEKRVAAAIAREEKAEIATIRGIQRQLTEEQKLQAADAERARKLGEYQRQSNERIAKQEQRDLDRIAKVSKAEMEAQQKTEKEAIRRDEDNIINDILASQNEGSVANINATRYALYDVAQTATVAGLAVSGIGVYAGVMASKFEYAFTSVRRAAELTRAEAAEIESQFLDLSRSVPVAFEQISEAATLGAQMGIAKENLSQFAEVVTRFSATTNASIDTTSSTFGRLSNLLNVDPSKFESLGSAIAKVGVMSVATETEILSTAQQIAGASAVYGFAADEVVGLASAFASLAIAPEAARGSVTRIFGKIEKATMDGAAGLKEYARIMNTDVQTALTMWEEDPSAFFNKLVAGLSQSKTLLEDLQSIGARDVRDQNLLQRLAGSPEVLQDSLNIAGQAFDEGTYLAEAYAVQTDNLQSKLAVLANTFNALAAEAGGPVNTALKIGVDILSFLLNLVGQIPAPILGLVTVLALLVGGFLLLKGAQAAAMAGLLALQTVLKNTAGSASITGINMASLNAILRQTAAMAGIATPSIAAAGAAVRQMGVNAVGAATATGAFGRGMEHAKNGALALGRTVGPIAALIAVVALLEAAGRDIGIMFESSADKAERFFGSTSGFGEAVAADTEIYKKTGDAITTYQTKVGETGEKLDTAKAATEQWLGVQGEVVSTTDSATAAIGGQTMALGENAEAWVAKALSEQESIQKLANNPEMVRLFNELGGSIPDFIQAGLQGKGEDYISDLILPSLDKAQAKISAQMTELGPGGDTLVNPVDQKTLEDLNRLLGLLMPAAQATDALAITQMESANTSAFLGANIADTTSEMEANAEAAAAMADAIDGIFSGLNIEADFIDGLDTLFAKLDASGYAFGTMSEAGRAALAALQDSMLSTIIYGESVGLSAADSLVPLFLTLQQQGVDTTMLLQALASSPIVYQADLDISALQSKLAAAGLGSLRLNGQQKALGSTMERTATAARNNARAVGGSGGSAREAAKEVRTLTDYVSDLGKVFKSAFDIRFGAGKALDDISSGWNKIAEANQKASDELRDYRTELDGLNADRQTLEFQLKVAVDYGDVLREAEIRAELAKVGDEIADAQKGADSATRVLSRSLEGNSAEAIENRSTILGLAEGYGKYVQELANTGMSQAELAGHVERLRQDFINQGLAMGYSRAQLEPYVQTFHDLTYAINNVPRNITVNADTNPAKRALEEFLAAASKAKATPSIGASNPYGSGWNDGAAYADGYIAAQNAKRKLQSRPGKAPGRTEYSYDGFRTIFEADGGKVPEYHAGGGKMGGRIAGAIDWRPRGTDTQPAMLTPGEQITNRAASQYYGDKMFEDINAMRFKPYVMNQTTIMPGRTGETQEVIAYPSPQLLDALQRIEQAVGITIQGSTLQSALSSEDSNTASRRVR